MKRVNRGAIALAALTAATLGAPALAAEAPMPMSQQTSSRMNTADAFITEVPALISNEAEARRAAIVYMDDTLALLDISRAHIDAGNLALARSALMAASGKSSTAMLLNFRDREFSQRIWPLTLQVEEALNAVDISSERALALVDSLRPQMASLAETQLAQLGGGGAGAGFETIDVIRVETEEGTMPGLQQQNVPAPMPETEWE